MKMFILILAIARAVDWLIEKNKKPINKPADFAKHRANWVEEERSQPSPDPSAPDLEDVEVELIHSIQWDAKTRKVETIEFKEV